MAMSEAKPLVMSVSSEAPQYLHRVSLGSLAALCGMSSAYKPWFWRDPTLAQRKRLPECERCWRL